MKISPWRKDASCTTLAINHLKLFCCLRCKDITYNIMEGMFTKKKIAYLVIL